MIILLVSTSSYGQGDGDKANNKIKGIYIYQFAKNMFWTNKEDTQGDFIIGVYGDKSFYDQLSTTYSGKMVLSQKIKVKYFESTSSISSCQILYIAKKYSSKVGVLSKKFRSGKTLVVSEGDGQLGNGSVINFIKVPRGIGFEISKTNASKKDLEIGQMLTKSATNIL